MAGISSDRPPGLQLGPIQNIAPRSTVAPISDFMEAFRNGFITIDDINKRTMATANQATATKTNIAAQDLQRRQIAGQSELLPGQLQNQAVAQENQALQLEGQGANLPLQNQISNQVLQDEADEINLDPNIRQGAIQRKTERQFQQLFGAPPPEVIQVPDTGVIAATFEDWYQANKAPQVAATATGAGGTDQDRAAIFNQLEAQKNSPATQVEYQSYVESTKNRGRPIPKGDPEYYSNLRNQIQQKLEGTAIREAQIKAIPAVEEARAKAAAEAPGKAGIALQKIQQDVVGDKAIAKYREEAGAFDKVQQLRAIPAPTNVDDLSLLYSYVKILDPTSVVREGELKLANSTVPAITAAYNKVRGIWQDKNKIIDPNTRNSIFNTIDTLFTASKRSATDALTRYANAADLSGLARGDVFTPTELTLLSSAGAASAAPATSAPAAPASNLESLVGKRVTLKNGQSGVVKKNPDGSYSLGQ